MCASDITENQHKHTHTPTHASRARTHTHNRPASENSIADRKQRHNDSSHMLPTGRQGARGLSDQLGNTLVSVFPPPPTVIPDIFLPNFLLLGCSPAGWAPYPPSFSYVSRLWSSPVCLGLENRHRAVVSSLTT